MLRFADYAQHDTWVAIFRYGRCDATGIYPWFPEYAFTLPIQYRMTLGKVHMAGGMLIHEASVLIVILNGLRLLRV